MSIATSKRCLNEPAQIQNGGKLDSSLPCSKLVKIKSKELFINGHDDSNDDDIELESFDQELHRRYNLMYFVPRSKFNKRNLEVHSDENGEDDKFKKRIFKRKSSPIKKSDTSTTPPASKNVKVNETVPVKDALYWWRNDPILNVHHEHWHIVFASAEVNGTRKDREGESFIYMHRFMLARYDAERYALGVPKVTAIPNYRDPIPDAFYPPSHLYEVVDENGPVHFPSRPPGQRFKDANASSGNVTLIYTLKQLEKALVDLENWIDGKDNEHFNFDLLSDPDRNADLGSSIEGLLHNTGHAMLGRVMASDDPNAPPGVLVGARAGCRDPLFWRWHRHIDDIYVRWQTRLGFNMFSNDIPPIKIRNNDIFFAFKDELFNLDQDGDHNGWTKYAKKTIGGNYFDKTLVNITGFTNELQTTMKQRVHIWVEDTDDKEVIDFPYPREFFTFFRIENTSPKPLPLTFRVFIVPEVFLDSYVHWMEFDKFKRILKPYEKTIISQDCDQSIGIRKPAQKTFRQMESTQMSPSYSNEISDLPSDKQAEKVFCGCGWPYHMLIPRGTKEGLRFKMMVYVSDGKDDLIPVAPTCGSQLLCGSRKWGDKYPDKRPMGYPFDRPFINKSFYQTFAHLPNVAIRDFTIRWVEDFPLLVPLNN